MRSKLALLCGAALTLVLAGWSGRAGVPTPPPPSRIVGATLPPPIVANDGGLDRRVSHYLRTATSAVYFTADGVRIALDRPRSQRDDGIRPASLAADTPARRWVVAVDFIDARPGLEPRGVDPLATTVSEFRGPRERWRHGLATSRAVEYTAIWPGIDLSYKSDEDGLKYELRVHPGADPQRIRMAWRGATNVVRTASGDLAVATPIGTIVDAPPIAYQLADGERVPVEARYDVAAAADDGTTRVGFALGPYDATRPLIIDPTVLVYAGFLGAASSGFGIAVDATGAAYVTGTVAGETDFPETVGPDLEYSGGASDAFIAKVAPNGTSIVYAGYLGGSGDDGGLGIAVDATGAAYVVGSTTSTEASFPLVGGLDATYNGGTSDAFVAKIAPDGSALLYSGYVGGGDSDVGRAIAVDGTRNAYVAGITRSVNFPAVVGPDLGYNGDGNDFDAFVAKVAADGASLVYAGYIGGNQIDHAYGVAVDDLGAAYVAGLTDSDQSSFPETVGPDLGQNGARDAFVVKVKPDGTGLAYAGFIGGDGLDAGFAIAVDAQRAAYVVGTSGARAGSTEVPFPTLIGPDLTYNGADDAFIAKVLPSGKGFEYAGFIGGGSQDLANGVAVDRAGFAYVTGFTFSSGLPTVDAPDASYNGGIDAFVAKVGRTGGGFDSLTYLGGEQEDRGLAIAVRPTCPANCDAFVAGLTKSSHDPLASDPPFPVLGGPDLTFNGTTTDAFVARLSGTPAPDDVLDPFLCHVAKTSSGTPKFQTISGLHLVDQFEDATYDVKKPVGLCPPAVIGVGSQHDEATHLVSHVVKRSAGAPKHVKRSLVIADRLGLHALDTTKPERVLVPAAKRLQAPPPAAPDPAQHAVDHYVCYKVKPRPPKFPKGVRTAALDQFTSPAKIFAVKKPLRFCTAADKNGEGVDHPDVHLLCYQVKAVKQQPKYVKRLGVLATSALAPQSFDTVAEADLCLPATQLP